MNNPEEITAIILARGKSFRMKMEKGLVLFNGKMLVEHVIEAIKKITGNIIIITANAQYKQFGYPCFADELEKLHRLVQNGALSSEEFIEAKRRILDNA